MVDTTRILGRANEVGYSTHGYKVIEYLNKKGLEVDQVMVFTDCQVYGGTSFYRHGSGSPQMQIEWDKYKARFPKARLFLFDMSGYGNTPLRLDQGDVVHVAGWSDRIFEAVEYLKRGKTAVDLIMKYDK